MIKISCYLLLIGRVRGEVEWLRGGRVGVEQARAHRAAYQLVEWEAGGAGGRRIGGGGCARPGGRSGGGASSRALTLPPPCGGDAACGPIRDEYSGHMITGPIRGQDSQHSMRRGSFIYLD